MNHFHKIKFQMEIFYFKAYTKIVKLYLHAKNFHQNNFITHKNILTTKNGKSLIFDKMVLKPILASLIMAP